MALEVQVVDQISIGMVGWKLPAEAEVELLGRIIFPTIRN
jgi:hypothetical protein